MNITIKLGARFQIVCEKLIMKFSWPNFGLKDNNGIHAMEETIMSPSFGNILAMPPMIFARTPEHL